MIEMWLTTKQATPQPPDLAGVFLFDPETRTDLINNNATVSASGTSIDTSYLIDGKPTTKLLSTGDFLVITIPTPIDLDASDWTVEWSCRATAFQDSKYEGEFGGMTTAGKYLYSRWTDGGYGYFLQSFVGSGATGAVLWRILPAKQSVVGILRRMALVCKAGVVTVFKDGVPQRVGNWDNVGGASQAVTQDNFPKEANMGKLSSIRLGSSGSTTPAALSNIGRIRISNYARYISTYTPVPF